MFYRLNFVRVALPPLRDRSEDIPLLVDYFLQKFAKNEPPAVQPEAMTLLKNHNWPGNVRELENAIRRALVMAKTGAIQPDTLPPEITQPDTLFEGSSDDLSSLAQKLFKWARANPDLHVIPKVERELIINALRETGGNQVQTAKLLGITRATLRKRIEKFNIKQELSVG